MIVAIFIVVVVVAALSKDAKKAILRLMKGVKEAVSVWYNVTGDQTCLDFTSQQLQQQQQQQQHQQKKERKKGRSIRHHLLIAEKTRMLTHPKRRGGGSPRGVEEGNDDMIRSSDSNNVGFFTNSVLGGGGDSSSNTCSITADDYSFGCWEGVCCNENLNLVNTISQGLGADLLYWPPSSPFRKTARDLPSLIGPRFAQGPGCEGGYFKPKGLFGVPKNSDSWSEWLTTYYGDKRRVVGKSAASNIVFSNGMLDPWSSAGVYAGGRPPKTYDSGATIQNLTEDGSSIALLLDLGAHHLDLFFSTDKDPECAKEARLVEEKYIQRWIVEHRTESS
eukprot:jgi/Bigna1/68113/fgenesh1_pg.5_\